MGLRLDGISFILYASSFYRRLVMKKILIGSFCLIFSLSALEEEDLHWDESSSVLEYNASLQEAMQNQDWWGVIDYAEVISYHFPKSPFAEDAAYLIGEAYYKLGQLELANERFTEYLNRIASPKHFEETIHYKFQIAEQFRHGARKPLFGSHKMPKIVPAQEDALVIYDDVIAAMPHDEIAAKSLLGKAQIQAMFEDYKPSLETLDLLIRKFPKHDLAAQGFLEKSHAYLLQCKGRSLDPALLDLAEVNLRKFRLAFPREGRIQEAEKEFAQIQENFAEHLMEVGRFFEKTGKTPAAILYYSQVIAQYPTTDAAFIAKGKLGALQPPSAPSETD